MPMIPILENDEVFALLENTRTPSHSDTKLFTKPVSEVFCDQGDQLPEAFSRLDQLKRQGFYLVGYLSYEASYFLADKQDFRFNKKGKSSSPLLHFYAFKNKTEINSEEAKIFLNAVDTEQRPVAIKNLALNMTNEAYKDRIARIKSYIRNGDTYQVNFTLKYHFNYQGSPLALYRKLRDSQSVEFGAFLNFPEYGVLSLSPELFVRKQGTHLESKPMKGTFPRGATPAEDEQIIAHMKSDQKTRSENVMIVDLLRNDLSRVASVGSVAVQDLFEVQTYETLHQMISTVTGEVAPDVEIGQLFRELFPCGSITGAPKLRTMQIIEELETDTRGVYTGAIGYLTPENDFCFNVPIRTCLAHSDGMAEMGIGGGILYESDPQAEFEECLLKARFLTNLNRSFQLIESMRYDAASGSIAMLSAHLERMSASAATLHFVFAPAELERQLRGQVSGLQNDHKVRVLLHHNGQWDIQLETLSKTEDSGIPSIDISTERTDSDNWLLQHKSTERALYNALYETHQQSGAYDVLFLNQQGNLTEASSHNLFIEKSGKRITPPVTDGLLPGIARQSLLSDPQIPCEVRSLRAQDLLEADRILLTNAVRGVVEVTLSQQAIAELNKVQQKESMECFV